MWRSLRSRRSVAVLAVLLAGATLAGCGGPSQVGAAAIVGDQSIPVDEVQQRVDLLLNSPQDLAALRQQGQAAPDKAREFVADAIERRLLKVATVRLGLTVTEDQITEAIEQGGGPQASAQKLFTDQAGLRDAIRDQLLLIDLANKEFGRVAVGYDEVEVPNPDQAKALAAKIAADPAHSAQLMSAVPGAQPKLNQNTAAPTGGDPVEGAVEGVIYNAPPNSVLVRSFNQGQQGGGYSVVYIRSISVTQQAQGADLSSLQVDPAIVGAYFLRPFALEAGIRVSPRYGVWDPSVMRVVPANEAAAGGDLLRATNPAT